MNILMRRPAAFARFAAPATFGLALSATCLAPVARAANLGLAELPASAVSGPVTVFYPTDAAAQEARRDGYVLQAAVNAEPAAGNRKLVVISHGSPGSPWGHADLARALVAAGFVVALPEHQADNAKDDSEPGPPAWRRRPLEVSRAIDRLAGEPTYARLLDVDRVGVFGMSAGGHTALTLAGGRWSPSRLREHCERNIAQDFHACAGPSFELSDNWWGRVLMAIVGWVNERKWNDDQWYGHTDARIVAAVAGVPFAADFDPATLMAPAASLALITARQDRWLNPRFHTPDR
jgi:predicted dienelactone hydrolase